MERYLIRLAETHGEEVETPAPSPAPAENTTPATDGCPTAVGGQGSYLSCFPKESLDFESRSGFNPRDPETTYKHNQDYVLVKDKLDGMQGQMLMLVLDGHGAAGDKVSENASKLIRDNLVKLGKDSEEQLLYTNVPEAFSRAFSLSDKELGEDDDCRHSGTTCVAMLIRGNDIWVANVGDSRAVMARRVGDHIEGIPLTRDHKPSEPDERERIRTAGGRIQTSQNQETERVWTGGAHAEYGLAMSRSLGDFVLKKWGVISEPEVIHTTFSRNDVFFCLATDGVWDVIEPQELVSTVTDCISASPPIKPASYVVGHTSQLWQMQFPGCYVDDSTLLIAIVNHPLTNDNSSEPQGPFNGQKAEPGHVDFLPQSVKNRLDGTEYEEGSIARNWFREQPANSASDAETADWLRGAPDDETIANWLKGSPESAASDVEIAEWVRGRVGAAAEEEIASAPDSAGLATPTTEIEHQPRSTGTISDLPLDVDQVDHIKKDS